MSRPKIIPDEKLRDLLMEGATQAEIARRYNVTKGAVSHRVKALNEEETIRMHIDSRVAVATIWDTHAAAQENYQRVVDMLDSECLSSLDRLRIAREIRQHLDFSMRIIEPLYAAADAAEFMEKILEVMDEMDPGARNKVLIGLHRLRAEHAAECDPYAKRPAKAAA